MHSPADEIEADPAFHAHGVRSAALDYIERFGIDAYLAVLNDALAPYRAEARKC